MSNRTNVHVRRESFPMGSVDISVAFFPTRELTLNVIAELDNAYDEAREQLAAYINEGTYDE